MSDLPKYYRKLTKLSFQELQVRCKQKAIAFAERKGWSSLASLPSDESFLDLFTVKSRASLDELLNNFRLRTDPPFFGGFTDPEATVAAWKARWPECESKILARAQQVVDGRFNLLAFTDLNFGNPIDWHLEPISGKRAPLEHWSTIEYLNADIVGDKKITWELNRHQYFSTLGQAYWLTRDELFARTFVDHLESWMKANPPKLGINWASSLEVSFRAMSWIWGLHFFKHSPSLTNEVFVRALKFLFIHARHLETYLSTYFSPNTHLTGEALGLFYLGTFFPEFKQASTWRQTGLEILVAELSRHVRPDGVYFEQSSYYHRYTVDFYLHFLILLSRSPERLPNELETKLKTLIDHLMYITRPDGFSPLLGDDDGGRLLTLDRKPSNDFRSCLATASVIFARGDYKFVSGEVADETLWLLGPEAIETYDSIEPHEPSEQSVAFPDGGYYVMRDGWSSSSNYLLFDCGPHGSLSYGHAHADVLSFEMAAQGRTLLVDPGTCTYTGSKEIRDWFRGSTAHNTMTVDDASSSIPDGPFSWGRVTDCRCAKWVTRSRVDYVEGHYPSPPASAIHARSILFLKQDYWIMRDRIRSRPGRRADVWFHFDSDTQPLLQADDKTAMIVETDNRQGLNICCFGKSGHWRREDGWVSHCYGEKVSSRVYAFSVVTTGNDELISFLLPQSIGTVLTRVSAVESIGGQAFEVTHEKGLDVVMIRRDEQRPVEMKLIASDFAWTWVRFSNGEPALPSEIVLLNGSNLELSGRKILCLEQPIEYLRAIRQGTRFLVESEAGESQFDLPVADWERAFSIRGF